MTARIRVLHVEADAAAPTSTELSRAAGGLAVAAATDAEEALDRLRTGEFDCVVSDYDLPGTDGIELLEAVRAERPGLPFVLFTDQGSEGVASDAISAGVTDDLRKGSGPEQYRLLASRIRNAVERTRAERARTRHLEAIETAREGISILDDDGVFIYVNEAYADLYGYDPDAMVGEHWELVSPDDGVETVRTEVLPAVETDGYWHGETTGLRADSTTFWEDHVVSRTDRGDLVCTVRDRSERRDRRAALRLKNKVLEEAPIGITIAAPAAEDTPLELRRGRRPGDPRRRSRQRPRSGLLHRRGVERFRTHHRSENRRGPRVGGSCHRRRGRRVTPPGGRPHDDAGTTTRPDTPRALTPTPDPSSGRPRRV